MKVLTIYLDPEILRKFKALCAMEGTPMTKVIQDLVKKYMKGKA